MGPPIGKKVTKAKRKTKRGNSPRGPAKKSKVDDGQPVASPVSPLRPGKQKGKSPRRQMSTHSAKKVLTRTSPEPAETAGGATARADRVSRSKTRSRSVENDGRHSDVDTGDNGPNDDNLSNGSVNSEHGRDSPSDQEHNDSTNDGVDLSVDASEDDLTLSISDDGELTDSSSSTDTDSENEVEIRRHRAKQEKWRRDPDFHQLISDMVEEWVRGWRRSRTRSRSRPSRSRRRVRCRS